jgi:hypothetical protein
VNVPNNIRRSSRSNIARRAPLVMLLRCIDRSRPHRVVNRVRKEVARAGAAPDVSRCPNFIAARAVPSDDCGRDVWGSSRTSRSCRAINRRRATVRGSGPVCGAGVARAEHRKPRGGFVSAASPARSGDRDGDESVPACSDRKPGRFGSRVPTSRRPQHEETSRSARIVIRPSSISPDLTVRQVVAAWPSCAAVLEPSPADGRDPREMLVDLCLQRRVGMPSDHWQHGPSNACCLTVSRIRERIAIAFSFGMDALEILFHENL